MTFTCLIVRFGALKESHTVVLALCERLWHGCISQAGNAAVGCM